MTLYFDSSEKGFCFVVRLKKSLDSKRESKAFSVLSSFMLFCYYLSV